MHQKLAGLLEETDMSPIIIFTRLTILSTNKHYPSGQ